jgi:hypothetical protein
MARLPNYVTRVDTGAGVRYEARVHGSRVNSSRFQHKRRFATRAEATAWYSKVTSELAEGSGHGTIGSDGEAGVRAVAGSEVRTRETDYSRGLFSSAATRGRKVRRCAGAAHHES